jgi:hypothetical protein
MDGVTASVSSLPLLFRRLQGKQQQQQRKFGAPQDALELPRGMALLRGFLTIEQQVIIPVLPPAIFGAFGISDWPKPTPLPVQTVCLPCASPGRLF